MADAELDAIRAKVKRGFLAIMQRKIDLSPELDLVTPDQDGNTLLHLAVVHNKLPILTYLLTLPAFQAQPVLQAVNAEGLTALQMARANKDTQPLAELLHTLAGDEVQDAAADGVQDAAADGVQDAAADGVQDADDMGKLMELKNKLNTTPVSVVQQAAVPKPGFWGGLFGLTIPPAAADAAAAAPGDAGSASTAAEQLGARQEADEAATGAAAASAKTEEKTAAGQGKAASEKVQTKLVLAQAAGWWPRGSGGGGGDLVTMTRAEFEELEKAQAEQLDKVDRLTVIVEEQGLKLDRARIKVETAERLAAKQEAALKALTCGGPSTEKDVHRLTAQVEELKLTVADKSKALAWAQKAAAAAGGGSQRGGNDGDADSVSELSSENKALRMDVAYLRAKLVDQTKAGDGGAAAAEALAAAHAALEVRDKAAATAAAAAKELRLKAAQAVSKQREAEARLLDCMDQVLALEMRLIQYEAVKR